MLAGTGKWLQTLNRSGWPVDHFDEGFVKSGPDAGREGLGAIAVGDSGFAWVIHGSLGGLFSRRSRQVEWDDVRLVTVEDDAVSVGLGSERGVVSFRSALWSSEESASWLHTTRYRFWQSARQHLAPLGFEMPEDLDPGVHERWSYYTAKRRAEMDQG